ncbi:pentatricopeptide repeat-containing protein [Pyrus ussuriensis x Pyrus communis]|uniref:Pentatricopeptide repeat-containing protein n=1 Tax=Pyrus ussuriensis x Pyrus communis TaxID=2448454 RepID=A0A5N5H281_9ROSA|nr:pentatricopeptide repeat-containing protein [Pyrus ussuriensis x Pyrus communis]
MLYNETQQSHKFATLPLPLVGFPKSLSPKRVLKLLEPEKNPPAAFALLDSVTRHPNYNHSPDVFHHILRRLVDPKLVVHVDRFVELIRTQKCKCPEDVALTVIKAYTKNSMPDKALAAFQQMEEIFGCAPGVRSYNSLLNAFIESNQWDRAEKFFAYFAYFETVDLEPNLQTYNVLIKISCKKKQFEKAKRLLNWMWEKGLEPDVFSYGTLINGHAKGGKLSDALDVFLRKGDSVSANEIWERLVKDSEVYPNVITNNVVVNEFIKQCWKGVLPDVVVHNAMLNGLCIAGNTKELWEVREACVADTTTYGVLVHGLCKNGEGILDEAARLVGKKIGMALNMWHQALDKGFEPNVTMHNIVIHGLCSAGKAEDALQFYFQMGRWNCFPNLVTYNTLMEGFHKIRDCEKASEVWAHLLKDGLRPDTITYNVTLKGFCSCSRISNAIRFLEKALHLGILPASITWYILVRAVLSTGILQNSMCHKKRPVEICCWASRWMLGYVPMTDEESAGRYILHEQHAFLLEVTQFLVIAVISPRSPSDDARAKWLHVSNPSYSVQVNMHLLYTSG